MNTVSFETAKALRDAGFPQPFPAFGQQWHFPETKELFLVTFVYSNGKVDYCMEGSQVVMLEDMPEGAIFAPTATDILAELESDFDISCLQNKTWMVICRSAADTPIYYFTDPNPHEAAARAYLQLYKPT